MATEKNDNSSLLLLLAAGFGVFYLWSKSKSNIQTVSPVVNTPVTNPVTTVISTPVVNPITSMPSDNIISTNPVIEQPISATPVSDILSNIISVPVSDIVISTNPVIEQPVSDTITYDKFQVSDIVSAPSSGGGGYDVVNLVNLGDNGFLDHQDAVNLDQMAGIKNKRKKVKNERSR